MTHRTSSSALHTARTILKNYDLEVRPPESLPSGSMPGLTNHESNVAVLVDFATNVFQIALLRPEVKYWQKHLRAGEASAGQIANLFQKILQAFEMLPKDSKQEEPIVTTFAAPKEFGIIRKALSKPAREVSRFMFYYYFVTPKNSIINNEMLNRLEVAKLAEVCLGLTQACKVIPLLQQTQSRLKQGHATESEVSKCLREVGIALQRLPSYDNQEEETKLLSV
jgi:hypothetical protein